MSWLSSTPEAAFKGIRTLVADIVKDIKSNDEVIPEPIACRRYSGKFMVRVPHDVHRNLAIRAAESGISLDRIVSSKLTQ